jgi:hypothetical protein
MDRKEFLSAVDKLCDAAVRAKMGQDGRQAFRSRFNWETVSEPLVKFFESVAKRGIPRPELPSRVTTTQSRGAHWEEAYNRHGFGAARDLRRRSRSGVSARDIDAMNYAVRSAGRDALRNLKLLKKVHISPQGIQDVGALGIDLIRCASVLTMNPRLTMEYIREYIRHIFQP